MKYSILVLFLSLNFCACPQNIKVKTGIETLRETNFEALKGKNVGLITNQTGVDSELKSTVDILFEAEQVNLVALFGPEHGVRGNFSAGDKIEGSVDEKTGLPVYSLYGKNKKPNSEMLKGIDVLVYDIQDIGARSYTYISTMGLIMEAAADNNIEVIILDRPNPLGGNRFEGAITDTANFSFVSQFPIPYLYGLTPGELALMLVGEKMLKNGAQCKLSVIKLQNWTREMIFSETNLPWVPTSPHIPHFESAFYYAVSGIIGELDANMIGVGYTLPFEIFATTWCKGEILADKMNSLELNGVKFRPIHFKPYYMQNKGAEFSGVQIYFTDFKQVKLTEIQFYFAQVLHELYPEKSIFDVTDDRLKMFDLVIGKNEIREKFTKNYKFSDIQDIWNSEIEIFRHTAAKYFLY